MRTLVAISCATALLHAEDYALGPDSQPQTGVPKGTVTKHVLPAGTYRISSVGSNFVQIGTQDKPIMETIATHADNNGPGNDARLVFTKYGDQYFLREVLCDAPVINSALPASKLEKQVQIRLARLLSAEQTVAAVR